MKKKDYTKIKLSMLIALIVGLLVVTGLSQIWFMRNGKSILEDYAKRANVEPSYDLTYITANKTALADSVSGSPATYKIAKEAFAMVNEKRKEAGLAPLNWSNGLEVAAMIRAEEVTMKWSHLRPDGSDYWTVSPESVYGENISKGFRTANGAMSSWMESESHRANLLDSSYTSMAIFIYEAADKNFYWVAEFGV